MTTPLQVPAMDTTTRDNVTASPGMMIFNTDTWSFQVCADGVDWTETGF